MQFSDRLRSRFLGLNRIVGGFYVAGVFVLARLAAYIQYFEERMGGSRSFSVAAGVDAALLMITTGIAFAFIRNGKIQQHRQWMTRSFAVALVFLEVRGGGGVTGWEKLGDAANTAIVFGCVAFSVLIGDVILQLQELDRTRGSARAAGDSIG